MAYYKNICKPLLLTGKEMFSECWARIEDKVTSKAQRMAKVLNSFKISNITASFNISYKLYMVLKIFL